MIRPAIWRCKIPGCRTWGLGGPRGYNAHHYDQHQTYPHTARLGAELAFGFNLNDETETRA